MTKQLKWMIAAVGGSVLLATVAFAALGRAQSPTLPIGVSQLSTETQSRHCGGGPGSEYLLAVFQVADGNHVWDVFPGLLLSPELRRADRELTVVVYRDGWPGIVFGAPAAARAGAEKRDLEPGTVDVCIETVDGSDGIAGEAYIVYGDVSVDGSLVADRVGH